MIFRWSCCSCRPVIQHPKHPHIISPRSRRVIRSVLQYSLLGFCLLILVLWIGTEYEGRRVDRAPDTAYLYQTPIVCGLQADQEPKSKIQIQSYNHVEQAHNDSAFVAHCGDCGQCSTPHDIGIYDTTKNSLFETTVQCAKRGLIFGRRTAKSCMDERVGFTSGCCDCWVENIMCDLRHCVFVCLWHGLFSSTANSDSTSDNPQGLNRCTECDEKRCGPAFLQCAGANRRRTGILSDIDRDQDTEVCQDVKPQWWDNTELLERWRQQSSGVDLVGEHLMLRH